MLTIVVFGRPAPQGSKRHVGGGRMIEMSKHVGNWRDDVKNAAEKLVRCHCPETDCTAMVEGCPLDGPIVARMVFSVAQSAAAKKRGDLRPTGMPDLSKLLRSTEDALTAAGVWKDDARLVEYERLAKVWAGGNDPDALPTPGAVIRISRLVNE